MNSNKSLLYDIKDIKDQLSDFGSCVSEQSDSSSDESERYTLVQRKEAKRKASLTPIKSDEKMKKANLDWFEKANGGLTH